MKLRVFQSDKGDCLLLRGADDRLMLVDGGMRGSYNEHVAPALGELRKKGEQLDVVYVSHIDQDHIAGVLKLMDDEFKWRVQDFNESVKNKTPKPPEFLRPPVVKAIWHNAFHEQVKDNEGEIESMLAASAAILSGSSKELVRALASEQGELSTSVAEAIKLTRRVGPAQLGIKLNPPAKGKLMMVRAAGAKPFSLGGMKFSIIGPFRKELNDLKDDWNKWLEEKKEQLKGVQKQADEDDSMFSAREIGRIIGPKVRQADALGSSLSLSAATGELGDRGEVTVPNLASLMLFVEEKGRTLLLTGDGHTDDITLGLKHVRKLKEGGGLHVNVLKVPHHASEHNVRPSFCRDVTADDYLFCGRKAGRDKNPDIRVIRAFAESRLSDDPKVRSPNKQAGGKFKFWFSGSVANSEGDDNAYMRKVESEVKTIAAKSKGKMSFFFLDDHSFDLSV